MTAKTSSALCACDSACGFIVAGSCVSRRHASRFGFLLSPFLSRVVRTVGVNVTTERGFWMRSVPQSATLQDDSQDTRRH